jgi:hypothetical protein
MYIFVLYGGWLDLQTKRDTITRCLIIYKMFLFIMQFNIIDLLSN